MVDNEVQIEWQPAALRTQAVELVREIGAGPAAFFRLVDVDGELRYANMEATGSIRELFVRNDGARAHETSVARKTDKRNWTAEAPRAQNRNRFATFEEDYGSRLNDMVGTDTHRAFYGPAEISDQARCLVYDHTEFLGFIAVMRRRGDQFARETVEALNGRVRDFHRLLLLARSAEREENTGALHLIADEYGHVLYADERARGWLTKRRAEQLRRGMEAGKFFAIDGLAVTVGWLDTGHRKLRHMLLSPISPLHTSKWSYLSETQRSIVRLALDGLSNREIARIRGLRDTTVKYHLRESTRALDVRGRSGLLHALSEAEDYPIG